MLFFSPLPFKKSAHATGLHPEHLHTSVGTFSGAEAKPESVIYYNNTKYSEDVQDQMERAYSVKGGTEDVQWWSSITSSTWVGSMSTSFSRSSSSRRARRKVLQQLAEELREEYMEGKGAAAVGTRWAATEATTAAAAADTEAVPVRKSCKQNQTSDT